jgi:virginiamycin B lyase
LWFTEPQDNKIGRITTTGELTEFSLPPLPKPGVASYVGITMGPDGALWFANPFGNQNGEISRITTAGAVTEFLLPSAFSGVSGITAGPDGALWFTERSGGKIGRITTAGAVTEFPIPPASHVGRGPFRISHDAWGITAGPDGALWFTETIANKIGRITTTGELREFLLPAPNSLPSGITAGPDGALWFTESDNNGGKIGRIQQIEQEVTEEISDFHWRRWILYSAIVASLSIIIAARLKRLTPAAVSAFARCGHGVFRRKRRAASVGPPPGSGRDEMSLFHPNFVARILRLSGR